MPTKAVRCGLLALAWPLLGCGGLERAMLQSTTTVVAGSALLLAAFAGVQIRRRKFGPIQFGTSMVLATAAVSFGGYEVAKVLRLGVPIATSYHVALHLSTLLWSGVLVLVASDAARREVKWPAFVFAGLHASLVVGTVLLLWPGPRLPDGAIVETSVSAHSVCVRYEAGEVVCYGRSNGTPGRWPIPLSAPPAVALHGGQGTSCLSTAEGALWCWGPTPAPVELPFQVDGELDEVEALTSGLLVRERSQWHYVAYPPRHPEVAAARVEVASATGREIDEAILELLNGSEAVAVHDEKVCVLQDVQVKCAWVGNSDVVVEEGLAPAVALATNSRTTCSFQGAEVRCGGEPPLGGHFTFPAPIEQLQMGAHHACVRSGGSVSCWGHGRAGRLGMGTETRAEPTALPLEDVTAVSISQEFTCAVLGSGDVRCWGVAPQGVRLEGEPEPDPVGPLRDLVSPRHFWDRPARLLR